MQTVIKILTSGKLSEKSLEFSTSPPFYIRYNMGEWDTEGEDFFDCLCKLRTEFLEKNAIKILCKGAQENVWSSPMQRGKGGFWGYEYELGKISNGNSVKLLDYSPPELIVSVDMQKTFFNKWLTTPKT